MSYRTAPNFKRIISSHNKKILHVTAPPLPCNCRKKEDCPMVDGQCRVENIISRATITPREPTEKTETYVGMTKSVFKERYGNHKKSFTHKRYSTETSLSIHAWKLKEKQIDYDIKWQVIDRATPFSPVSGVCNLCTLEKYHILFSPESSTLNKNDEIYKPCVHRRFMLLDKT